LKISGGNHMPRIKFVLSCSVLLAVVFATNGLATPVNYSYQGNPFTNIGCAGGFAPYCVPGSVVRASDFITAQVTADITLGVAGTYQATSWSLGVTGALFNPNVSCPASPCTLTSTPFSTFEGSFSIDVDDLGQVTNWSGDVRGYAIFYEIRTSLSGDSFWVEQTPARHFGSNQTPGTWTLVSVPEVTPIATILIGLAAIVGVSMRNRKVVWQ
jgi:hypothetical protein